MHVMRFDKIKCKEQNHELDDVMAQTKYIWLWDTQQDKTCEDVSWTKMSCGQDFFFMNEK